MPSIQTTDWLAVKAHVDGMQIAPTMPVYEPDATIVPPKDAIGPAPFILLSDVPDDPQRVGIGTDLPHTRSGTLLLTVQWPIARAVSHVQLREIAGQIASHFPADTCMSFGPSRLRVTQDPSTLQPFTEGAYKVAVVRVRWSSM